MALDIVSVFNIFIFVEALWLVIPAYGANGLVPIIKGRHPIDGGKRLRDGQPVFGPGKTWEGLIFGCFVGAVLGTIEMLAFPCLPWGAASPVVLTIVPMGPLLGFLLGFGAMLGDLAGSFIKRRFRIGRGKPAPLLDQEDFLVGALLFALLMVPIKLEWVIILAVLTPIFHWVANGIAYLARIKKEPY